MRVFNVWASSLPLATLVPNFIFVTPSIAELARGEKLCTILNHSITHSIIQLIWCAGNRSFCFGKASNFISVMCICVSGTTTYQEWLNTTTAWRRHLTTDYVHWLDSADDCHGSIFTGAAGTWTADSFAGGGGGRTAGLLIQAPSVQDDFGVTAVRCWLSSDDDEDVFHGSTVLPSTSCMSSKGSIPSCNIQLPLWCAYIIQNAPSVNAF